MYAFIFDESKKDVDGVLYNFIIFKHEIRIGTAYVNYFSRDRGIVLERNLVNLLDYKITLLFFLRFLRNFTHERFAMHPINSTLYSDLLVILDAQLKRLEILDAEI